MNNQMKNKEFVLNYFNAMSGIAKTRENMADWVADPALIEHKLFFESAFPKYEVFADEMTSEGNRIVVKARMTGRHEGILNDIQPTFKAVNFPFIISYVIENNKIVSHWLVADQVILMEQLGVYEPIS